MDKLEHYRTTIKHLKPANGEIEVYTCFDVQHDRYQVFHAGWNRETRIFDPLIHIDILNNKIWIQYDGTEEGVANDLVELGIPKDEIVLAYHHPIIRQYNGFAMQ